MARRNENRQHLGDRPLQPSGRDRLGFGPIASQLVDSIVDYSASTGFVIGIEGGWGAGKSTIVNFVVDEIERDSSAIIVRFAPWLIGSRDALLSSLFAELELALLKVEGELGDASRVGKAVKGTAGLLQEYARRASGLSGAANLAALFGVPFAGTLAEFLKRLGDAAGPVEEAEPLHKLRDELEQKLLKLPKKIIVFIDDLDRLEPSEVVEVLRLVRAVADFPNIVYVLCYDSDVIGDAICKQLGVPGRSYLDKIVQLTFKVPQPETFDLRNWFRDEIAVLSSAPDSLSEDRREFVIDFDAGHLLRTPRDVVRTLNGIGLYWYPIQDQVDFLDMVWLQLIRLCRPDFYAWVEAYSAEAAQKALGARVSDETKSYLETTLAHLLSNISEMGWAKYSLAKVLPGVSYNPGGGRFLLFESVSRSDQQAALEGRRLASPEHSRLYFSFARPAGGLGLDELSGFLSECVADKTKAAQRFQRLAAEKRPQGGSRADLLVERLCHAGDEVRRPAADGIFTALADGMDIAAATAGPGPWGEHSGRGNSLALVRSLASVGLSDEGLDAASRSGQALAWLTEVLRHETFAHGLHGSRSNQDEQIFEKGQFEIIRRNMIERFRQASVSEILATSGLLSLLHGWGQASTYDEPRAWLEKVMKSDRKFVDVLDALRKWGARNGKVWYRLSESELRELMDVDVMRQRLERLAQGDPKAKALRDVLENN